MKRIRARSVSEVLSDNEKRRIVGGYDGSGTYDDPYVLPEVVVKSCLKYGKCDNKSEGDLCDYLYTPPNSSYTYRFEGTCIGPGTPINNTTYLGWPFTGLTCWGGSSAAEICS